MREIGVSLIGLGNVGSGVVRLLAENAGPIEERLGARLAVRAVAVRAPIKKRHVEVDAALITTDVDAAIDRDDVDIVCELIGGDTDARRFVLRAIERGKHVVTANKALLALHGEEIFGAAARHGVDVYYEAAVCAGVPIIRALREGLASDRIEAIVGIVNGTSNFILSAMTDERRPFGEVLAAAQAAGYAEADPALDVDGIDAAHKLSILATLCFGARVPPDRMYVEGIGRLDPIDFEYAARFGYVIKPLVIARDHEDGIEARVHPAMIPRSWLLASVAGAKNALYVRSNALGPSLYYGAGAGMMPTAVAAVSDLIEVSRNIQARVYSKGGCGPSPPPRRAEPDGSPRRVRDIGLLRSRYYMRFGVHDRPGVLGQLATVLGGHAISIAEVVQEAPRAGAPSVRVVVVTHEARESDVRAALPQIEALPAVAEPTAVIRIAESP
jgi:homoserine dehydrogenase